MPKWLKVLLVVLGFVIVLGAGVLGGYLWRSWQSDKTGAIKVSSIPVGALISLDGKSLGKKTPYVIKDVKPGKHAILLKRKGYVDWKISVTVTAGEESVVEALLVKAAAGEEAEPESQEFQDTVAPSIPAQVAPADDARIAGDTATLEWSTVSDESGVTYSVEIQYRAGGGVGFVEKEVKTGLTSTQYTYTMSGMTERWRVWAVDGVGNSSPKSDWWSLVKAE